MLVTLLCVRVANIGLPLEKCCRENFADETTNIHDTHLCLLGWCVENKYRVSISIRGLDICSFCFHISNIKRVEEKANCRQDNKYTIPRDDDFSSENKRFNRIISAEMKNEIYHPAISFSLCTYKITLVFCAFQ